MIEQNQQSLLLGKIAAYTEILVKDPSSTIFISLAETYRKMGMFDDARQIISKGLELHPDVCPAYIVLARILCQLEDFTGSIAAFERALELDQDNLAALVGYARVQILLGEEGAARRLLLSARTLSPADPVINKLLLSLPDEKNIESDNPEGRVETEPVKVEKSSPLVSSTLAELYLVQGLTAKALDLFQRLSTQNPDNLSFRRRVKELESQLREEKQRGTEEPADVLFKQQEALQQETEDSVDTSKISPRQQDFETEEAVPASLNGPSEDPILSTLNRWLSNIQQRRENV